MEREGEEEVAMGERGGRSFEMGGERQSYSGTGQELLISRWPSCLKCVTLTISRMVREGKVQGAFQV